MVMYTLEELCRDLWRSDEKAFRKLAADSMISHLIPQFERDSQTPAPPELVPCKP